MSTSKKVKLDEQLEDGKTGEDQQARFRAIAVQHALSIEEKKKLQDQVLDMILVAFDLPSDSNDAAHPSSADATTFKTCLNLFRPADLDELVEERNIDDRCGYALCRNSVPRQDPSKNKVWDPKTGKLVEKENEKRWCSKECRARNTFVRRQLLEEPAWLRQNQGGEIHLLSDMSTQPGQQSSTEGWEADAKMGLLPERHDGTNPRDSSNIEIHEKEPQNIPQPPNLDGSGLIEGFPMRMFNASTGKSR